MALILAEGNQIRSGPPTCPRHSPVDMNNQNSNNAKGSISEHADAMGYWQSCDRPMVISIDSMRVGHGNINDSKGLGGSHPSDR